MSGRKRCGNKKQAIQHALDWFGKKQALGESDFNNARRMLNKSDTFVAMQKFLGDKYIAVSFAEERFEEERKNKSQSWDHQWKIDNDQAGVLSAGPCKGRRVIRIIRSPGMQGSRFIPPEAADSDVFWDEIRIQDRPKRMDPDDPKRLYAQANYISRIAHELAHVEQYVRRKKSIFLINNYARSINLFIDDEIEVRKKENQILSEILSLNMFTNIKPAQKKRKRIRRKLNELLSFNFVDRSEVERGFISGSPTLTYLEKAVIEQLMARQAQAEGWTEPHQRNRLLKYANRLKLGTPLEEFLETEFPQDLTKNPSSKIVPGSLGGYVDLALIRRVMQARWKAWEVDTSPKRPSKEQILQEHSRAFFPPNVSYTAL